MAYRGRTGGNNSNNDRNNNNNDSIFKIICAPCDALSETCGTSIIFVGFVAFYILSFLWDVFVIRGGYLTLSIAQLSACVNRTGYDSISPALILSLLFIACFHAISLVWIIGFVHSKKLTRDCLGDGQIVDVPTEWFHPSICVPFLCFDVLMIIQFGLSLYVYLFLQQLIYDEPEGYVDKFCIGYDETEEAFQWMQISLIFFVATIVMGCIYCCLIRIATNDISILQTGQQQFIITSPRFQSQSNDASNPQNNQLQNQPL